MSDTSSSFTSYYGRRSSLKASEWTANNFKSIEHAMLPLNRLTVLTGANSSGKSSLIQSLLLLAQSSDDEVILNGPLVRLGEASDIIRSGSSTVTLSYSVTVGNPESDQVHEWHFAIGLAAGATSLEVVEFDAAVDGLALISATSARVTSSARDEVNPDQRFGTTLLRVRETKGRVAPARTYLTFSGLLPEVLIVRRKKDKVLAALRREFSKKAMEKDSERLFQLYEELQPWWRSHKRDLPPEAIELYESYFQRGTSPRAFLDGAESGELDSLFTLYAEAAEQEGWQPIAISRYLPNPFRLGFMARPTLGVSEDMKSTMIGLSIASDGLKNLRDSVRYLGPLREEPQVVSPSGGRNRSLPAGTKGEYTADLLVRDKNRAVRFHDADRAPKSMKLPEAVSNWATYLGVGDRVAVQDQGKLGRGLRLQVNGVERDLTTVGVGASQLLPVIAVVLAADAGSVVCIEQPELHLHPAVQTRLADFFLWARPDIQLVIETHSEYLITRTRRRAAEGLLQPGSVSLFFAEQSLGVTNFRELKLDSTGNLSAWPAGFFDTQDEEARALVLAVSRSRGKEES